MGPMDWVVVAGLKGKKKKKGLGRKYKRVVGMVWCGETMCDSGFQEVRTGIFFLGTRLIDSII